MNASSDNPSVEALLIDYHLDQLAPAQREAVRQRLADDPATAEQYRRLHALFDHLDAAVEPQPPADLERRVLEFVTNATAAERAGRRTAELAEQAADDEPRTLPMPSSLPLGTERGAAVRPILSLREVAALAAAITLIVSIFVPGYYQARRAKLRMICAKNLQSLGAAMVAYGSANDRQLPFAGSVEQAGATNWWPASASPGQRVGSNSRHIYLLVRRGYAAKPKRFVCPARREAVIMQGDSLEDFEDFPEAANFSFASQCRTGEPLSIDADPEMPLLADANPLFDRTAPPEKCSPTASSCNHGDDGGQNVLFAMGHFRWSETSRVGLGGDNIWTARGADGSELTSYTGTERPAGITDAFLIP